MHIRMSACASKNAPKHTVVPDHKSRIDDRIAVLNEHQHHQRHRCETKHGYNWLRGSDELNSLVLLLG